MPRSLILAPTYELAAQVAQNFEKYGMYHKLDVALLIGGVSMDDQVKTLEKGVDVLIATLGRLIDLFGRGRHHAQWRRNPAHRRADRMLHMGFIPYIEKICTLLPPPPDAVVLGNDAARDHAPLPRSPAIPWV